MSVLNGELLFQIYSVVEEIPRGNVATYGQIASLIGMNSNSRLVGKAMSLASFYGDYPCHRVVNSQGRLVPGWIEQKDLLLQENIVFKKNGNVDLNKSQWLNNR